MKNLLIFGCVFLVTTTLLAKPDPAKEVEKICRKKNELMVAKKVDSLAIYLDESLLFIHSSGSVQTKKDVVDDTRSGKMTYRSIETPELKVRMFGTTAVVTGRGKFTVVREGNDVLIDLLFTEVYVKKGKLWLLASRHASRMP